MYGCSSCCLNDSFKAAQRKSGSLYPYVGCAASHTEFGSVGARNIPDRLRFTKAVLRSKDVGCGFAFPCQYGSPSLAPAPVVFKQLIWASKRDQSLKIRTTDPLDVSTETKSKISHVSGTTVINTFSSPIAYFSNKVISKSA